ncbi:MAG: RNA-binding protein, partial [Syntrophaceae bacterium]|nr:RNA-binding protein [Syntrophaceae bacterium]
MEYATIFVGNLVFDAVEEDLKVLFSEYGTVASIKLRRKKGYALVEMANPEEARSVIRQLNQHDFKGRPMRLNIELPPKKAKA